MGFSLTASCQHAAGTTSRSVPVGVEWRFQRSHVWVWYSCLHAARTTSGFCVGQLGGFRRGCAQDIAACIPLGQVSGQCMWVLTGRFRKASVAQLSKLLASKKHASSRKLHALFLIIMLIMVTCCACRAFLCVCAVCQFHRHSNGEAAHSCWAQGRLHTVWMCGRTRVYTVWTGAGGLGWPCR